MTSPLTPIGQDDALGFYGVSVAAVAREMPLFREGFSADSTPSRELVATFIRDADASVQGIVYGMGIVPVVGVAIASRLVIAMVKLQVIATVYAGNEPESIARAVQSYRDDVKGLTEAMRANPLQLAGGTVAPSGVRASFPTRAPLVDDAQLDGSRRIRSAT